MSGASKTPSESSDFNLSTWALSQKSLVIFIMLVITIAGAFSYVNLSRNEDPPFTIKTMVVGAKWPGATIGDAVRLLTDKMEQKLEETPYLDRLESYTRDGQSVIFVHLRDDTPPAEVQDVWYQVRKKMSDLAPVLPQGVLGPFLTTSLGTRLE